MKEKGRGGREGKEGEKREGGRKGRRREGERGPLKSVKARTCKVASPPLLLISFGNQ